MKPTGAYYKWRIRWYPIVTYEKTFFSLDSNLSINKGKHLRFCPSNIEEKNSKQQSVSRFKWKNHDVPSLLILSPSTPPTLPAASSWTISNDALNESAPTDKRLCVPGAAEFFPILSQELTPIIAVCRLPSHILPDLTNCHISLVHSPHTSHDAADRYVDSIRFTYFVRQTDKK